MSKFGPGDFLIVPLPSAACLACWHADYDPYGILQDPRALYEAERVEDILQLRHRQHPARLLDLGCYGQQYRAMLIEHGAWQNPLAQSTSACPQTVLGWFIQALTIYA